MTLLLAILLAQDQVEMSGADVVHWMEEETRRTFVFDEAALRKRIVVSRELLKARDPYETGLGLLRQMQLAAVPVDKEGRMIRIVHVASASRESLAVYGSADELPKADEYCTLSLRLRHLSPRDLQAVFIPLATLPQNVLATEAGGTLLLSDYASKLRSLAEITRQLDRPRASAPYRLTAAALLGTSGVEPSVPEAYRAVDLSAATGRNRFTLVGEASVVLDIVEGRDTAPLLAVAGGQPVAALAPPPSSTASLRIAGPPSLTAEMAASLRNESGPTLERFAARLEREGARSILLLETRVDLKAGEWRIAGSVSGEKEASILVFLVRADRMK